jgi:hypothetical protein
MNPNPIRAPWRLLLATVVAALLGVTAVIATPAAAHAAQNPTGTAIYGPVEFFAYVKAGESLQWDFQKLQGDLPASLRVEGQGGTIECGMTTPGTACTQVTGPVAASGIWRFQFSTTGTATATDHATTWQIQVLDGGAPVTGRVWTEEYEMTNLDFSSTVDLDFWYLGEFGDLYRAAYSDFNGVNSTFLASGVGLVQLTGEACVPQYRSAQREGQLNPADPSAPLRPLEAGECEGRYKIFFEEPDSSMLATTTRWDGATTWLFPPVTDPVVSDVVFDHDNVDAMTGDLSFRVADFQGSLQIQVDANADGDLNDAVDRVIPYFVASNSSPVHHYTFDGRDGLGERIASGQKVVFTVAVTHAGEVHFVNTDVETRGGLQILSLRGPDAGDARLYFDDRVFGGTVSSQKCSVTPVLDGTAGIDTSSGPVHGWAPCGFPVNVPPTNVNNGSEGSWGDARHIHDWTFRPVDVSASVEVVGLPVLAETGVAATAPAIGAGVLLLGGIVRRGMRRRAA